MLPMRAVSYIAPSCVWLFPVENYECNISKSQKKKSVQAWTEKQPGNTQTTQNIHLST